MDGDMPTSTPPRGGVFDSGEPALFDVIATEAGPRGALSLTAADLLERPSGDVFGWTQDVGMGWHPGSLRAPEVLILSTQGGIRAPDGSPIALGYHTGHWEVGLLMQAAALELRQEGCTPFAGFCTDPCDGRTQGTVGMFDSLAFRNDAAIVLRRLIRSLPTRQSVLGVATCDKGLPAMMMALAGTPALPTALIPGGVTLPASDGEDCGAVQTIGARFAHGRLTLEEASALGCRACGSPGGGCQFLGTAATAQVMAEALGLAVVHSALTPSGQPIWLDMARRSARALVRSTALGLTTRDVITDVSIRNAMVVHAAFGGSTNMLLHLPAVAHAARLERPSMAQWSDINRQVPRLVDALPNGPHPTVRVFMAGGVPEVMLQLRKLDLIDGSALTAGGATLDTVLAWWETSERRGLLRERLRAVYGVEPDDVIMTPGAARRRGVTSTITFLRGNLAPEGAITKSTAIDRSLLDRNGVFHLVGPARVFTSESAAITAIKSTGPDRITPGEVIVLIGRGPMGAGMEEVYQVTSALKFLDFGKTVALLTDARFSGVSTGPCIGHIGPEALAGGPIGRLRNGDLIRVIIDTANLTGSIDLVAVESGQADAVAADRELQTRACRADLCPDPGLPDDTRLWAILQQASGGTAGGCVYDVDRISQVMRAGLRALHSD